MLPRLAEVLRHFPFSESRSGVQYASVQPVDWAEPSLFEESFSPGVTGEQAAEVLREYAQADFAVSLEAYWDLWVLDAASKQWVLRSEKVIFTAQGLEFDEGAFAESGHILIDFGLDFPFLHEGLDLSAEDALRVKANVAALIEFTHRVERNCHTIGTRAVVGERGKSGSEAHRAAATGAVNPDVARYLVGCAAECHAKAIISTCGRESRIDGALRPFSDSQAWGCQSTSSNADRLRW